ncbi:unnamed protein product [Leptidea sinapis]|uniref:Puromycin-sensitive aminopeptidase n=1 Tax=Leptidea sinapis TaxID=189913 RepID=A0A5E4QXM2_9NEOP|nr:unnamed protein product [Leptidea sinapis]
MPENKPFERLPKNVSPKHYELHLVPNLEKLTFTGTTRVKVSIDTSTKEIKLNSLDLELKNVKLQYEESGSNTTFNPVEVRLDADTETATIVFEKSLPEGNAVLYCDFTGEINDKMKGLYRSKYLTPSGEERYAAVTQFEATDARRCFPCWDEPAIKATFDITLEVPADRVALSNMPAKEEKITGNKKIMRFDTTPIMSTYLVAVVVGEYDYVEKKSNDGVLVRVYTPVGKSKQGLFALEVAAKVLPYYKDYFNIAYPLPKIDLIAIADFSAGAMENWGLVTYRETCLLVDEEHTSAVRRQWIALVVGHELAHQWFGNLVTMEWWTHLWLNEGYASFVEFLCVNHLFPEYDIWTQFVTETYIRALELDCLKNSHPIEVPVGHPSEIDEIFDDISYNKGASVIRMLHRYIGDDDFRKGMNIYLTRHQYKNTFTEDLWAALEEASNKPVGEVSSEQRGSNRVLKLMQQKFCADGSQGDDTIWMVPITISTQEQPSKVALSTVLDKRTQEVVLEDVSENSWVKLNPGTLSALFSHTALDKPLKNYGRKLFANVTKRLGWDAEEKESHLDTLLRSLVLNRMITFELHSSGACPLPADLRSACYRAVLSGADEPTFDRFLQLYRAADLHEEKDRISRALGAVTQPHLLNRASAREIEEFFASHKSPGTERSVQQAVETVRLNAAWLRRDLASTTANHVNKTEATTKYYFLFSSIINLYKIYLFM